MIWITLALLTALFESGKDVFGKLAVRRADPLVVAWAWRFFALPLLLPLLIFFPIPALGSKFWWALAVSGGLNVVAAILYMQALQASDLSITVPMINLTPLFLLLTSPLILGEVPEAAGATGVFLVVAGSYLLHLRTRREGLLAPFRALWRERGPRLMLLVALLWSITANVDKIGVQNSSPLFWALAVNAVIAVALLPAILNRKAGRQGGPGWLLATGLAGGLTALCQMTAITLTLVPYVIAIKRSSTVMSVLWGRLIFGERGLGERLVGVLLMVAGVALITLF